MLSADQERAANLLVVKWAETAQDHISPVNRLITWSSVEGMCYGILYTNAVQHLPLIDEINKVAREQTIETIGAVYADLGIGSLLRFGRGGSRKRGKGVH